MSLPDAERNGAGPLSRLPYSLRVLAENMLRHEDGVTVNREQILGLTRSEDRGAGIVSFAPGRVLMQDSAGLPVLADLAALIEASEAAGSPIKWPVDVHADLVVDHSLEVDYWGTADAAERNLALELQRNASRYHFLRWAEGRFPWLKVIPPGGGICHQLNLEVLAPVVAVGSAAGRALAGCDSVIGTDSHTTMINGLSVFGWGVGGLEAMAVLLGQPIVMPAPAVLGVRLVGKLANGITATDAALSLTAVLRRYGVVRRIVEFCGPGLGTLTIPDRATIANMAPEYGATMGFFPADEATLSYLAATGRTPSHIALVRSFLSAQGLLRSPKMEEPSFDELLTFDLGAVERTVSGPNRPEQVMPIGAIGRNAQADAQGERQLADGAVVIAALSSCTNTSNPRLMAAAGLVARQAVARGIHPPWWVKASLAPGSQIISSMLRDTGLQDDLDRLGFQLVGHGCTTCMGNSGPLPSEVAAPIEKDGLTVAAVLCGNRNFEGRIHPLCRLAYLMSPPMVVAFALAGTTHIDLTADPVGIATDGAPVFLDDLWPDEEEIDQILLEADLPALAKRNVRAIWHRPANWSDTPAGTDGVFAWEGSASFIRRPPFLSSDLARPLFEHDLVGARALLILGDGVTTDDISPVSAIPEESEAGRWLGGQGLAAQDYGSYSARRLNHDVMLRGGFANIRLRNGLVPDREGGFTALQPDQTILPVSRVAALYRERGVPMVVIAGARYGTGSARDWAAKVTRLLGVSAVLAESFERIHRTNLVAMGVLPLILPRALRERLTGRETFDLLGVVGAIQRSSPVELVVTSSDGGTERNLLSVAIETETEAHWLEAGGIFPIMLRREHDSRHEGRGTVDAR